MGLATLGDVLRGQLLPLRDSLASPNKSGRHAEVRHLRPGVVARLASRAAGPSWRLAIGTSGLCDLAYLAAEVQAVLLEIEALLVSRGMALPDRALTLLGWLDPWAPQSVVAWVEDHPMPDRETWERERVEAGQALSGTVATCRNCDAVVVVPHGVEMVTCERCGHVDAPVKGAG